MCIRDSYSLTKYAGGHSDLVAGGVLGAKHWLGPIRMMRNTIGTICDPHTAWMLLRSMETVELRMSRAGENAEKVCAFLRDHPKVNGLGYLGSVSYTHLTLPTSDLVEISVVAVSLKKKKTKKGAARG